MMRKLDQAMPPSYESLGLLEQENSQHLSNCSQSVGVGEYMINFWVAAVKHRNRKVHYA